MAIDTSIYSGIRPIQQLDVSDAITKAAQLSQYARQNKKLDQEESDDLAMREAFKSSMGEDGKLNKESILNKLKSNPAAYMKMSQFYKDQSKEAIDEQTKKLDMAKKVVPIAMPVMLSLASMPENERAANYNQAMKSLEAQGVPTTNLMKDQQGNYLYDPNHFKTSLIGLKQSSDYLENQLKQSQIDKNYAEKGGVVMDKAAKLRQERSGLPTTKATQDVSVAYNKIQKAAGNPSAAGDMSMIFGYMKMLDPGSTVREGEFANAQNAAGIPTRILNVYNKVMTGERLSEDQRGDFLNQAKGIYSSQIDQQNKIDNMYRGLAKKQGIDPEDTIVNFTANEPIPIEKKPLPFENKEINTSINKTKKIQPNSEDMEGLHWLNKNPNHPDAISVRATLLQRGVLK